MAVNLNCQHSDSCGFETERYSFKSVDLAREEVLMDSFSSHKDHIATSECH